MPYRKGSDLQATTSEVTERIEDARICVDDIPIDEEWNQFPSLADAETHLRRDKAVLHPTAEYTIVTIEVKRTVYHYA